MNIRTKLILRFSLIVASILITFSIVVYMLSERYRREEFYSRLESRAITTGRLFVSVSEVDQNLLRIIDRNSIHALYDEKVLVYDSLNQLVYSSLDDYPISVDSVLINEVRQKQKIEFERNHNEHIGICYSDSLGSFVIISSANDKYGKSKLENLRTVLWSGLVIGLIIIILMGTLFSSQMLSPIVKMNADISNITARNLGQRIDEGNRRDEIALLAINFNKMLERLETAFSGQQQFVSNASHELRNPLAAMSGQLQAVLDKERNAEEYKTVLWSLYDDTIRLVDLSNGLLQLAQSGLERQKYFFTSTRIDEVLFNAQNQLLEVYPMYTFQIEFDRVPEDESLLVTWGNDTLLQTVFINLMDNACKFSENHNVTVRFNFDTKHIYLQFEDSGIGIPADEIELVFQPFYRASNAINNKKGSGIGLSLCQKIVHLHQGDIRIHSTGHGTTVYVQLPILNPNDKF